MKALQITIAILVVIVLFGIFGKDNKTADDVKTDFKKQIPTVEPVKEVRLSENIRSKYIEGCVEATDGVAGGYAYCECTIKWLEDNSTSNSALLAEFASYETADGITPRMEKAIDYCIEKINIK